MNSSENNSTRAVSMEECLGFPDAVSMALCGKILQVEKDLSDTEANLYIVAGVLGGILLLFMIFSIIMFVKFSSSLRMEEDVYQPKQRFANYYDPSIYPRGMSPPYVATPPTFIAQQPYSHHAQHQSNFHSPQIQPAGDAFAMRRVKFSNR